MDSNALSYYSRYENKAGKKYLKKEQVRHLYVTHDKSFEDIKDISLGSTSKETPKRCKCESSGILILRYFNDIFLAEQLVTHSIHDAVCGVRVLVTLSKNLSMGDRDFSSLESLFLRVLAIHNYIVC